LLYLKTRKLLSQFLVICLILGALNGTFMFYPQPADAVAALPTLNPVDDAQVDGGSGGTANQAVTYNGTTMNIKEDSNLSTATPFTRRVYMRFNLSGITNPNAISTAKLRVYATSGNAVTTQVYAVSETNAWSETTLNWNNRPTPGTLVESLNLGTASGYYEVDLTSYIKSKVVEGKASIVLINLPNGEQRTMNSKDNSSNKPELVFTTDTTPPAYQSSTVSANFKDIQLNFNEALVLNAASTVKDNVYVATNGVDFTPLGANDSATLSGSGIQIQLQQALSGSANKFKVTGAALKDAAGNILGTPVITEALIGQQDASAPVFTTAVVGSDAKSITLTYDKPISMSGTAAQLKDSITLSLNGGTTYGALQSGDSVAINGNQLSITLNQALTGFQNKIKVASGALKSTSSNTITGVDTVSGNLAGLESARTIAASADARVDSAAINLNTNYGTETVMQLKEGGSIYNRRIFVKFDVSPLGIYNSAKMRIYFNDAGSASESLSLYPVDDSWTEGGLTYSNQPQYSSTAISSANVGGGVNGWVEWDVTSYIQQQKQLDGWASFVLLGTPSISRTVSSKENGANANGAQLLVTYDKTAPIFNSGAVSNENKSISLTFSENIESDMSSNAALKANIYMTDANNAFVPLGDQDRVAVLGNQFVITLANRLVVAGAKVRVLPNTLRDTKGNVLSSQVETDELSYDLAPPVINSEVALNPTNKILTIRADEALLNNKSNLTDLRATFSLSTNGTSFAALSDQDTVAISNGTVIVTLQTALSGAANRLRIAANALKDSSGNALIADYTSSSIIADNQSPQLQSTYTVNFNKKVVLVFDEGLVSHVANEGALKAAVQLSTNGGASYQPLGSNDKVSLSGRTITVSLEQALTGSTNRFKLATNTIKDNSNNVADNEIETSLVIATPNIYPYAPPSEEYLLAAMNDTKSIVFGNKPSAEGSGNELIQSGALAVLANAIASGDRNPDYIDRYVSSIQKMLTIKANMPNLQGGLDSRGQSQMVYAVAMLWNDTEIMNRFSEVEKSKLITFIKAGLISTAYTLSDYDQNDNLRPADRIAVNGDPNAWNGGNTNHSEPNVNILLAASFVLGLENVKSILQSFDLPSFISELNSQGLIAIKESYETTTNFGTLANKATIMQNVVKSSKWSFKGITLDDYLANPMKLYRTTQGYMWSLTAQDGDYIGSKGMAQEFNSTDQAGNRQSASYVILGIDPSLLNRVLLHYYGYWNAPGNETLAAEIHNMQKVGVSDYYAKVINGYYTQSWLGTHTDYLTPFKYFVDSMITLGLLKPVSF
jgi:hypothetical protein